MIIDFRKLKKEDILASVSDQQIYEYYLGCPISLSKNIKSPFRKDNNASLSFFVGDSGDILWRDWGDYSQSKPENVFTFVSRFLGLRHFKDVLSAINDDMVLDIGNNNYAPKKTYKKTITQKKFINLIIEKRDFQMIDYVFWMQFGVSLENLKRFNVFPINSFLINKETLIRSKRNKPMYAYEFCYEGDKYYKIYNPKASSNEIKFIYNGSNKIIQGLDQLEYKNDLLIITKSLKDVIVLYELGYESISPQSENTPIPKEIVANLKNKYKNLAVFYDNDKPGMLMSSNISNIYDIPRFYIDTSYNSKDISDFVRDHGKNLAKTYMELKLKQTFK